MSALVYPPTKEPYVPPPFTSSHDLALYNVAMSAYIPSNPSASGDLFDGIATGSLVINPQTAKLLLVQRAPHDSMPLRWETPGGAVDKDDKGILHGAARELYEETGLAAINISKLVGGIQEFHTRRGLKMGKLNFLAEVEVRDSGEGDSGIEVKLDPNEHVQYVWATEEEARAKKVGELHLEYTTRAQEETIYEAFNLWKERHTNA